MDTLCIAGPQRLLAIGLMGLTLAACGGGTRTDSSTTPTGDAPSGEQPPNDSPSEVLDCARDNYPCSFNEVSLPVIERSLALSDEVAQQLDNGVAIDQVATFLSSQSDVAEVTVDGPVLGFRLAGGRPMIVDVTGDQELLASPAAAAGAKSSKGPAKTQDRSYGAEFKDHRRQQGAASRAGAFAVPLRGKLWQRRRADRR